jgi:hypothetical protein
MDKEEARFILRCFRPDGADAENPDFAEALAWAAKDRELGEWLVRERARDAGFAAALSALTIPTALREEILAGLAVERGEASAELGADAFDRSVMGAMAGIRPPARLRGEILAAMERTLAPPPRRWWHYGVPAAAAAGVVFALMATRTPPPQGVVQVTPPQNVVATAASLPISRVEEGFIRTFEAPGFRLDLQNKDHHALFEHIKNAKLPCPNRCLPKGLKQFAGYGCRQLEIDGKKGALVCFKQDDDIVHLVVFKRCDVKCRVPKDQPSFGKHGKWARARWSDDEWVFVLMGEKNIDVKRLEEMF